MLILRSTFVNLHDFWQVFSLGKFKFEHRKINGGTNNCVLRVNLIQINTVNKRLKLKIVSIASSLKKRFMLWKQAANLEYINITSENTLIDTLGIRYTEIGEDYITASMPVNKNTVQPFRILHGGASVALAESLGSIASTLCIADLAKQRPVGVEINANHLKSAAEGTTVYGKVSAIRVGKTMHVWNIEIKNEDHELICISRLTVAIIGNKE